MKVIIRISPHMSETANGWTDSKWDLVRACNQSYLNASQGMYETYYMCDNCPTSWLEYFEDYGNVLKLNIGNKRLSVERMLDLGKSRDDDILFLEDDYLWRDDFNMEQIEKDIKHFGVITPLDHPSHYLDIRESWQFEVYDNNLYRDCKTSTHTFAVRKDILKKYWWEFNFGQHDWIMWTRLRISGQRLFSPVPSYALHLAKDTFPLGYDYQKYFNELIKAL